jgi:hypothetical protein
VIPHPTCPGRLRLLGRYTTDLLDNRLSPRARATCVFIVANALACWQRVMPCGGFRRPGCRQHAARSVRTSPGITGLDAAISSRS